MSMMSDEFAVYLPAVNEVYARDILKPLPASRPLPSGITLDDFAFWNRKSTLWYHPHFLHSVGNYKVGQTPDNAMTRRGWTDGVMFGDSGGFQIGRGKLEGIPALKPNMDPEEACAAWRDAYHARAWILQWLETHANYSMTMDMPPWAATPFGAGSPSLGLSGWSVWILKF